MIKLIIFCSFTFELAYSAFVNEEGNAGISVSEYEQKYMCDDVREYLGWLYESPLPNKEFEKIRIIEVEQFLADNCSTS